MEINADLNKTSWMDINQVEWRPSPLKGVDRRMLERKGDEVAICATVVRYAPESYFDPHTHDEGEEFVVLEGVFSDDYGDWPAGYYIRNPPGSRHKPHTKDGCQIFVRLRQFLQSDTKYVRINTADHEAEWTDVADLKGASRLPLHSFEGEDTSLLRLQPKTVFPRRVCDKVTEVFILDGSLNDALLPDCPSKFHSKHSWIRYAKAAECQWNTEEGCTLLFRTGRQKNPEA